MKVHPSAVNSGNMMGPHSPEMPGDVFEPREDTLSPTEFLGTADSDSQGSEYRGEKCT